MTKVKKRAAIFIALSLVFVILISGCGIIQKTPEAINRQVVADIGAEKITRAQLDVMYAYLKENIIAQQGFDEKSEEGKKTLADQKRQLLDDLVEQKVLEQKAKELKLFKDDKEISDETLKIIDTNYKAGKTDEEYKKWLSDNKLTQEVIDNVARFEVVGNRIFEYLIKDVAVTDDEIKNYYNTNMSSYTEKPNTMEVSHILVLTEELAKTVKEKLDKGEDFAALANQYSIDTEANKTGGALGEIQYNDQDYDPTFVLSAMVLKEGEISQPVLTQFGYHIIKVTKKTEYPILPMDKVKDDIKDQLLSQAQEAKYYTTLTEWKDKAGIKLYDNNIDNVI